MPSAPPASVIALLFLLADAASCQQGSAPPVAPIIQPGAPGHDSKTLPSAGDAVPEPHTSEADIKFMQGMIMHHNQAVEMTALITTRSQNKDIQSIGNKISISQSDEMKFMKRWLEARGQATSMHSMEAMDDMPGMGAMAMPLMPGMLSAQQMQALRQATGSRFDHLFLTGMIQHHTGALTMVEQLFNTAGAGQDADLFDFATDVDNTQRAEINIMQGMLKEKP